MLLARQAPAAAPCCPAGLIRRGMALEPWLQAGWMAVAAWEAGVATLLRSRQEEGCRPQPALDAPSARHAKAAWGSYSKAARAAAGSLSRAPAVAVTAGPEEAPPLAAACASHLRPRAGPNHWLAPGEGRACSPAPGRSGASLVPPAAATAARPPAGASWVAAIPRRAAYPSRRPTGRAGGQSAKARAWLASKPANHGMAHQPSTRAVWGSGV